MENVMKRFYVMLILLATIACTSARAYACSCAGERAPCQEYWETSAVFIGTVINSRTVTSKEGEYDRQMRSVRISIDESFRGIEGAEAEILTGLGGGDCGFGFRQAQQYIVYAHRSETDQKLYTSICARTRLISEADQDLAYIRGLSKAKRGGTITGEVVKYVRNAEGGLANQPLTEIKVTIEGEKKYETVTDANGKYSIDGIAAGEYTVSAAAPQGLASRGEDRKVKVADRGCAEVSIWLESSARLSGRVLNPEGLPVPKAEIFMMEADKERYQGHWDAAYADEEGKYVFKLVPPGRYVLTVRYDGLSSQKGPFPTTYYPGVSDKSQAQVFKISEGQVIEYDLKVPPLPVEYTVQGTVLRKDGTLAPGARVEYVIDAVVYGAKVDDRGNFSFKAYEGLKLSVRALIEIEKGKYAYGNPVEVVVGPGLAPIKIVMNSP